MSTISHLSVFNIERIIFSLANEVASGVDYYNLNIINSDLNEIDVLVFRTLRLFLVPDFYYIKILHWPLN